MKKIGHSLEYGLLILISLSLISCVLTQDDRCGDGYDFFEGACHVDTGEAPDTGVVSDLVIGSSCSCQGDECDVFGAPSPTGGTINGCDDVPTDWPGGLRACLRSYEGTAGNDSYFANGYCSLMAANCEGNAMICGLATIGDYDAMSACPDQTVLVITTTKIDYSGMQATVDSKRCAKLCAGNEECRTDEVDPLLGDSPTQYQCIDRDGVKFCFDPRSLPEEYTATEF